MSGGEGGRAMGRSKPRHRSQGQAETIRSGSSGRGETLRPGPTREAAYQGEGVEVRE